MDYVKSLTDEALAHRLVSTVTVPRTWTRAEREAFILEAARRLRDRRSS